MLTQAVHCPRTTHLPSRSALTPANAARQRAESFDSSQWSSRTAACSDPPLNRRWTAVESRFAFAPRNGGTELANPVNSCFYGVSRPDPGSLGASRREDVTRFERHDPRVEGGKVAR